MSWFTDVVKGVGDALYAWHESVITAFSKEAQGMASVLKITVGYPKTPPQETPSTPRFQLSTRGTFQGDLVLLIGRTGAGKSSVINMLKGEEVLPVGDVGSTTRWLEGVPLTLKWRDVTLVDSPGIGEAFTDSDYNDGILEWYRKNKRATRCIMLVLQADARAHADDERLVECLRSVADKPLVVVLNQVDKVKPAREEIPDDSWHEFRARGTLKSQHIEEKMQVVTEQFRQTGHPFGVVPIVSEPDHYFNRAGFISTIVDLLPSRW